VSGTVVALRSDPQALPAKVQYAHELANSGLLPAAFRRNPPNVLFAIEYGEMLGLPPMAAITGIHVIEGKPSASAGLISALVRRAGHKLRVSGNAKSATCQITRCDDPDYTFEVTWTLHKNSDDNPSAEAAKLLSKEVWQKYAASMLKSRAISQCARDACEEALFGLHYTPEELGAEVDEEGNLLGQKVAEGVVGGTVEGDPAEQQPAGTQGDDPWQVHPAASGEATVEELGERATSFATVDAGRDLWREVASAAHERLITRSEAKDLHDLITLRIGDLQNTESEVADAEVVEGVVVEGLDPEDEWHAKVETINDGEDAAAATADLDKTTLKQTDPARYDRILAAISARAASIPARAA
jgi:hypothetical protein